ncbi:hypothetical protein SRABI128_05751 [Microbacterium sp. Bi128]|nr:hypothetical protein SRABI128_05751 [Microbacterium sp. Bi128]
MQVPAAHRVEQAQGVLARDAEDRLGAERLKGFDDEVPAVAHAGHREATGEATEELKPAGRRDSWPRAWAA